MLKYIVIILLLLPGVAEAKRIQHEKDYQKQFCNGEIEYVLPDKTRVDCLTEKYAQEYDFSDNWPEAIGQTLYYAERTGKKAMIVLINERPEDCRHVDRARVAIESINCPKVEMKQIGIYCE